MPPEEVRYWFPAKRYGWGWGMPRTWQGWTVVLLYTVALAVAGLAGRGSLWKFPVFILATVAVLLICLKKGEPTKWRWGGKG